MNLHDFVKRIQIAEPVPGVRLYLDERKGTGYVHSVLSMEAGTWRTDPEQPLVPSVLAQLLDEGTTTRPRDVLRRELELLGSEIRFDIGGEHLFARIEGLANVFEKTCEIASDMLMHPALTAASLEAVTARLKNEYNEDKEDTRKIAYAAATATVFEKGSALRSLSPDEKIDALSHVTHAMVQTHAQNVLRGPLTVAIVGDCTIERASHIVKKYFSAWPRESTNVLLLPIVRKKTQEKSQFLAVPNKENIDVFFVNPTDVHVEDGEYVPLSVASELLGSGGFTGHLMKTVRERDGLTYGIYARLRDSTTRVPLLATIWATFGTSQYARGVAATKKEIGAWQNKYITKSNLDKKKIEILGSYIVSLQDPEDVAWQIISTLSSGRPLSFIAEYPDMIQALTVSDIKQVAQSYFAPELFSVVAAGGQPEVLPN